MTDNTTSAADQGADLAAMLEKHRGLFLITVQGLTDDQARLTPTVSSLSLGGLVKHVTATQNTWSDFIEQGAPVQDTDWANLDAAAYEAFADGFRLLPEETLEGVLADYAEATERMVGLAGSVDLGASHQLPKAPWFADEAWSNARVLMHMVAETAQHAGHADIIREAIDGQHSMG